MSSPVSQVQVIIDFLKTNYRFDTFSEPRGVMRILQVIFAAWAFMACRDFTITASVTCGENDGAYFLVQYPFEIDQKLCSKPRNPDYPDSVNLKMDSSLGAQIFVITSGLAFLYAAFIIVVYMYLDEVYKSKPEFPMADFALTGILGFFWFVSTLSLNSNADALQAILNIPNSLAYRCDESCKYTVSSFTDMNITLMMGALNIFLWVADLWFLYKETLWFQNRNGIQNQMMGQPGVVDPNQQFQPEQQQFQQQDMQPQQQQQQQQYYSYDQGLQQQPQQPTTTYDQGWQGYSQQPQF